MSLKNNKKNNKEGISRKINIRVTDIVARPKSGRPQKITTTKEEIQESDKPIQIEISEDRTGKEPVIINVAPQQKIQTGSLTFETGKELPKIEEKVKHFEELERGRFREEEELKRKKKFTFKTYLLFAVLFIFLAAALYSAIEFLPRASIKIFAKTFKWHYFNQITATKKISTVDDASKSIPAEVFLKRRNLIFSFPATGRKSVERRASGKITIYNAYSSKSQSLVAQTRFSTPDGKIFRLVKKVVVPKANVLEGKIVVSSIETDIIADRPGPDYNLGPISRLSIPAFAGSPKYDGFYGVLKAPTTGGFVGESAFPTSDDIQSTKSQAEKAMSDNLESFLDIEIPKNFKYIDGSKQFNILTENVNQSVDDKGNFSIFLDAQMSIIAFREEDLLTLMKDLAQNDLRQETSSSNGDFETKDYKLDYGTGRFDVNNGELSFAPSFDANFWQPIDATTITEKVLGKNEDDLRTFIYGMSNVEKATISFWPFWVKSVPASTNRVTIKVE